ncbi:MAG: MauE/DoxX family redox-associated membrane protein [Flavobacteriales bacterium]
MWNTIIKICRLLVGSLFIVSGLIKANDALGFMYKLEEYFEPGALNLPGLTEWTLPLAVFICVGEILLGVAMVIGALPRLTATLTGVIMAFFTWLT